MTTDMCHARKSRSEGIVSTGIVVANNQRVVASKGGGGGVVAS